MLPRPLSARLGLAAAALFALLMRLPFAPASATVFMDVSAGSHRNEGAFFEQADNTGNQNPIGGAVHGVAASNGLGTTAFVSPGPAASCDIVPIGFSCATEGPGSRAAGEVRGDLGRLRLQASSTTAFASGVSDAISEATVRLQDTLQTASAGPVTFHLHLSVDVAEFGLPSITIDEDRFALKFALNGLSGPFIPEFDFSTPELQGSHNVIDETFVLPNLPANTLIGMSIEMHALTECGIDQFVFGGDSCSVAIDAGNTAYLGIDGDVISESGYSYPGFQAAAAVPAPASFGLFTFGLVALGARRIRGR